MLELDAPASAVAIWLEGNNWCVRFPDAQLIEIPAGSVQRLQQILQGRAKLRPVNGKAILNSMSLPTQEILDRWKDRDDPGFKEETWEERIERAGARQRAQEEKRKLREVQKKAKIAQERRKIRDAEELLQELGL
jgi:hypothetical protein